MKLLRFLAGAAFALLVAMTALPSLAADYPAPVEGDWVAKDFRFHTGEVMPNLRLHYTTIGSPSGQPVLILHGTAGSGTSMLSPVFAGELFGPGQPLDASKYFIILPDGIGHGKSAKPSDGLRAKFPQDNDFLYQWESSGDYNPAPGLERIQAPLLAINSADDERNPTELGIMERELRRVKNARLYLIPGSEDTRGHGTTFMAKFWKAQLQQLLDAAPSKAN